MWLWRIPTLWNDCLEIHEVLDMKVYLARNRCFDLNSYEVSVSWKHGFLEPQDPISGRQMISVLCPTELQGIHKETYSCQQAFNKYLPCARPWLELVNKTDIIPNQVSLCPNY